MGRKIGAYWPFVRGSGEVAAALAAALAAARDSPTFLNSEDLCQMGNTKVHIWSYTSILASLNSEGPIWSFWILAIENTEEKKKRKKKGS